MQLQRRWVWAVAAVGVWAIVSTAGAGAQRMRVTEALDLYARGEHANAVDAKPFGGFEVATAITALEAWIGPADVKSTTPQQRAERVRRQESGERIHHHT